MLGNGSITKKGVVTLNDSWAEHLEATMKYIVRVLIPEGEGIYLIQFYEVECESHEAARQHVTQLLKRQGKEVASIQAEFPGRWPL